MSYESKCGGQVFAQTGHYRGVVVRIKELKFSKKKDISRDDMKELRILREIRHNNLNSFIGACVEPMRILLLTEYCAKGSLYVRQSVITVTYPTIIVQYITCEGQYIYHAQVKTV